MDADPLPYRALLLPPTRRAHDLHREALQRQDWLAAGVWGAVFLEALLEEAMRALGLKVPDRLDLGSAINRLRGMRELPRGGFILDRCEQVRLARNALVHANPTPAAGLEAQVAALASTLATIVREARPWFARLESEAQTQAPTRRPVVARVFLSTITPHLPRQDSFLRDLQTEMLRRGLEPVRVVLELWNRADPMGPVLEKMRSCDALLCVGLERSHAYLLRAREGGAKESEKTHEYFSSGWLNMEAGAAFALGIPVLVMCEPQIVSDGIFDRDWNSSLPFVLQQGPLTTEQPAVQKCLDRLEELLRAKVTQQPA